MDWLVRPWRWIPASTLLLTLACGDDGPATSGNPGTSTSAGSTGGASETQPPSTSTEGDSTGGPPGTTSGATSQGESTTGEVELCNGWDVDATEPYLALFDSQHQPLVDGGTLGLVCGGQGSWMFPIFPEMGGWELDASYSVVFSVEVVVEGFPGATGGSFYDVPEYYYDLVCYGGDEFDGGFSHDCIAVTPPDTIPDLAALDGAPATIHVAIDRGGVPIVIDLVDVTISAPPEVVSQECYF